MNTNKKSRKSIKISEENIMTNRRTKHLFQLQKQDQKL